MDNISGFLQKFLKIEKDNKEKIRTILRVINKETGLELAKESIQIKGDNLKINASPIVRNEIFMRKPEIESSLKSQKICLSLI